MVLSEKVRDYYQRGGQAMSLQEITEVLETHPWLPRPKQIIVLDGDVQTKDGTAIGLTPPGESVIILTPISNQETLIHELVHKLGFGEMVTYPLSQLIARKNFALFRRPVTYQQTSDISMAMEILQQHGIAPAFEGYPEIRHYVLAE
jgi:hypothetical protein